MEMAPMVRLDMEGCSAVIHAMVMHGPDKRCHEQHRRADRHGFVGGPSRGKHGFILSNPPEGVNPPPILFA
jgi:hypothetical protein